MNENYFEKLKSLEEEKQRLIQAELDKSKQEAINWANQFVGVYYKTTFSCNYNEGLINFGHITKYELLKDDTQWKVSFKGHSLRVNLSYYNINETLFHNQAYRGTINATFIKKKKSMEKSGDGSSNSQIKEYDFLVSDVRFINDTYIYPNQPNLEWFNSHFIRITKEEYDNILEFAKDNSARIYTYFDRYMDGEFINKQIVTPDKQDSVLDIPYINLSRNEVSKFPPYLNKFLTKLDQFILSKNSIKALNKYVEDSIEDEKRWSQFTRINYTEIERLNKLSKKVNEGYNKLCHTTEML